MVRPKPDAAVNPTKPKKRLAWIIGNSDYGYVNTLKEPANDAYLIASALRYKGYKVQVNYDLTLEDLRYALKKFSEKIDDYDTFIFYYAGHGLEVDGVSYIVPIDANFRKRKEIPLHCMDINDIATQFKVPNIPKLILIDACRENIFKSRSWDGEYRGGEKGQLDFPELLNSKVIYSTQPDSKVRDDNQFAEKFAEAIEKGGCIDEILRDVARQIIQISNRRQALDTRGLLYEEICFGTQAESSRIDSKVIHPPISTPSDDDLLPKKSSKRVSIKMVKVKGGRFEMGCIPKQNDCGKVKTSIVEVEDFLMSPSEITNAQFVPFLNSQGNQIDMDSRQRWYDLENNNAKIEKEGERYKVKGGYEDHPVVCVSWYGAMAYCEWLSEKQGITFRLPNGKEWEYAAKGGVHKDDYIYSGGDKLLSVGWFTKNTKDSGTRPIMTKKPNTLGLYDMSGNVWEWCNDIIPIEVLVLEKGKHIRKGTSETKKGRIIRGGCWYSLEDICSVTYKHKYLPEKHHEAVGFRIVSPLEK